MAKKNAIIIPITLVAEGGGATTQTANANPVEGLQTPSTNSGDIAVGKAMAMAKSNGAAKAIISKVASQTASLALSGWGDITGNYTQGANLQLAVSEAGKIAGAVALGTVGVAMYAVDKGVQAYNYVADRKKSEMRAEFAQKRVYGTTVKS